ncbi:hypothetical protein SH449x_002944 [Pirellulaceae bacterium SH449]
MFVTARNNYYAERFQTESALAKIKGISNIKLHSYNDVTEEIRSSSFSIDSQPGSIVQLGGLVKYADEGRFSIHRIPRWRIVTAPQPKASSAV